jgi:hypothetical protein
MQIALFSAASYCHSLPFGLCCIFQHYFIKASIFGRKFIEHYTYRIFLRLLSETFFIPRRIQRYIIIKVHRSAYEIGEPRIFLCMGGGWSGGWGAEPETVYHFCFILNLCSENHVAISKLVCG